MDLPIYTLSLNFVITSCQIFLFQNRMNDDQYLIDGIRKSDSETLSLIYQEFYPVIQSLVTRNSGTTLEAQEIMQRALISIYERLQKDPNFALTSKFSTFLYGVGRNHWLKEIRKKKTDFLLTDDSLLELTDVASTEVDFSEEDFMTRKHLLFWKGFEKLGEDCKYLLRMFFEERETEEIANTLGITYGSYRVKKTRCIQRLTKNIQDDSDYNDLTGN